MSMEIKQHLKLSQQLVMTPQLQQAIKLLQLSRMELVDSIRDEMLENPVLEDSVESQAEQQKATPAELAADTQAERIGETETPVGEPPSEKLETTPEVKADTRSDEAVNGLRLGELPRELSASSPPLPSYRANSDDLPSLESTLTRGTSLFDHLEWQIKLGHFVQQEEAVALLIIGNLDADGYLDQALEEIAEEAAVPIEFAESVLKKVQELDPPGVAARNLQECLLLQAQHVGADDDVVIGIITRHLGNLEKKNYGAVAKDLNQPLDEIYEAAKVVMAFDPKPGRAYTDEDPAYISPDVFIHKVGDKYFVVANDDGLPKLKISGFYRAALHEAAKAKEYIQEQAAERAVADSLYPAAPAHDRAGRPSRSCVSSGSSSTRASLTCKPLILRDVAEDIGMHESTVSRVTTNKYVHTPQGLFELKYFFNSGIARTDGDDLASEAVKLEDQADHLR